MIMTSEVHTCTPEDGIEDLALVMTERRFRHIPVVVDGHLTAIVSIGDIVKGRIDELQTERDHLVGYIQQ
jgi:CBS domain-containing protein